MKERLKKCIKPGIKSIAFVMIFLLLFFYIQDIFELKGAGYGKYTYYNQEEDNSMDILYFGNSRVNRAIDPIVTDEIAGTYSFNYGIQGLRANHIYYRVLDALKTQKPKLVVLETSVYLPSKEVNEESYIQRTLVSLPTSPYKFWAAMQLGTTPTMKEELFLPLLRFHSRYREIDTVDFFYNMDLNPDYPYDLQESEEVMMSHRGYTPYPTDKKLEDDGKKFFDKDYAGITDIGTPEAEADDYFKKMIAACREAGAEILLLSIPSMEKKSTPDYTVPIMNYLAQEYANDSDIKLLDLSKEIKEVGLYYNNYHNKGHVNRSGAKLISNFVGNYIKDNYSF